MSMKPLDLESARKILDFSGGDPSLASLGELQLNGAVALHNMIADPKIGMAYLADEVGMGKTYVALGVVSLMRYFDPSIRVLYICPSNNVQDKWFSREYRSFCKNNIRVNQFRIRTIDGKPAAPRITCHNVPDLILNASSGYYADFFVGMSSFSLHLSEDEQTWTKKLEELKTILPALELSKIGKSKKSVKDQYALALNYVLPTFDLVIIDEAHKFKHDFSSSDRNYVLSKALGFGEDGNFVKRVTHALLLSATPYDRNINQLRNQLKLVGHGQLLPEDILDNEKDRIEAHLSRFLVRRLNCLQIAGKPYTRNMYRREWRQGDKAEIKLETDEQKLVTALVQKKVGEMLERKSSTSSFQTGLLASFESYAESTNSDPVQFDGDETDKESLDAKDKHIVGAISDAYIRTGLGTTLPHPKMDIVSERLHRELFLRGCKQLVFVRRVKSVKELKNKLDDHYSKWLKNHIQSQLNGYPDVLGAMNAVITYYFELSRFKDEDISGGEFKSGQGGEAEDKQPPKNDTLFAWFFRGEAPVDAERLLTVNEESFTTPEAMRIGLGAKNQLISSMLEINWASSLARSQGENLTELIKTYGENIARIASRFTVGATQNDQLELFVASQLGFLQWYADFHQLPVLKTIVDHFAPRVETDSAVEISVQRLQDSLQMHTLYCAIEQAGLIRELFPRLDIILSKAIANEPIAKEELQTLDIHKSLISVCLRTGHGVIDLYLARIKQGVANLTSETRASWMNDFGDQLQKQSQDVAFSTYFELSQLSNQLDLIIKTNLPEIYDKSSEEYRKYLSQNLNPVAPVIGATGETVSTRSAQARKFRMPGYPMALISTDVFQEGEDLHTFCDSVTHYGLSGSPVSIEQKTGRVDRVGAKAHRRLLALDTDVAVNDELLIQVTFPFVRESIEVMQVRQLCHNINAFIESLHEIGSERVNAQDIIDADLAFKDRSAIPEQIRTFLSSPYIPQVTAKSREFNREQFIADQASHSSRIIAHVSKLLTQQFGRSVLGDEGIRIDYPDGTSRHVEIELKSARASGEILLCATIAGPEINLYGMNKKQLRKIMQEYSWRTLHRTYVVGVANREFKVFHNAELIVGDEKDTSASELKHFFERFQHDHNPRDYRKPENQQILKLWKNAIKNVFANFGQQKAHMQTFENKGELGLTLSFGKKNLKRRHHIRIYETQGLCIFLAQTATPDVVKKLSVDQLIRLTWQQNQHIDIVEFMLDENMALIGRAIHPIESMDYKEFVYCAYTLAVSTDRLEYLIQVPDIH